MQSRLFRLVAAVILALPAMSASAQATSPDNYPTRPIRVYVPAGAGSSLDIITRIVSDKLAQNLGQAFVIENKPGAGGIINMNALKRMPADGYTLTLVQGSVAAITPFIYKEANFDVERDYEVIGTIATTPMLFAANVNFPAKSLGEAIAMSKAKPGGIPIGNTATGTLTHLANEILNAKSGAQFQLITFPTSVNVVQSAIAGDISVLVDGIAPLIPLIKAGRLKALAVASDTAVPGFESIPLAKDDVPGLNIAGWFVMLAPKGTPAAVINRLNREINDILKSPDVVARLQDLGTFPKLGTPESALQFIKEEKALFGGVIKAIGLQPQ
jgi:tripartite-type tricarboxylate transporter receptor subunit TctC